MKFELLSQVYIALAVATLGCSGHKLPSKARRHPL